MQLNILEHLDSRFISQDRRGEQGTGSWDHKQVKNCSVDSVQQPEFDLFSQSGATSIKVCKASVVIEGAGEEGRATLLGGNLGKRHKIWG